MIESEVSYMFHPRITWEFENEMLELIDEQDQFTRSDLQGMVTVLVNKILEAGQKLPSNQRTQQ